MDDVVTHTPQRTCIGCRKREPRSALVRLVAREHSAVVDPDGTLPGRGAWLHRRRDCLDLALRSRACSRHLRTAITDTSELESWFDHGSTGANSEEATKKAGRKPMGAR
ncbi:YlxR family protein [Flaviflexus huanghaiensis]|uniref:YlxR family protein n=1 Tax=Flaviflexus huanghaiensis TaxID=1111473 RepID=UPI0015F91B63|nr:YlxR family protein [Flaviflexus huanghaiensis]